MKPMIGERKSARKVSWSLPQLTPSPNGCFDKTAFMRPTPTIDPMSVCELEAGIPTYQVAKFQMSAEKSSAKTIANPAADPAWMTSSTGSNATMPKATAPLETTTPVKFQIPDQTTAYHGLSVLV